MSVAVGSTGAGGSRKRFVRRRPDSGMRVACPYCAVEVDVTDLVDHVRSEAGDGHGPRGSVPFDGVDNPWNLRLNVSETGASGATSDKRDDEGDEDVPSVEVVEAELRRGRCPNCEYGVMGLKGGSGLFSRGHRRLACPNCRWESPEWIRIEE